jgi:hypothetical protein
MKVIDIQIYRNRKTLRLLEQRIGELALTPCLNSGKQMKTCFKEWLKVSNR